MLVTIGHGCSTSPRLKYTQSTACCTGAVSTLVHINTDTDIWSMFYLAPAHTLYPSYLILNSWPSSQQLHRVEVVHRSTKSDPCFQLWPGYIIIYFTVCFSVTSTTLLFWVVLLNCLKCSNYFLSCTISIQKSQYLGISW